MQLQLVGRAVWFCFFGGGGIAELIRNHINGYTADGQQKE